LVYAAVSVLGAPYSLFRLHPDGVKAYRESLRGKEEKEEGPGSGMRWKGSQKRCLKPSAAAGFSPRVRARKRRRLEKLG
jgi:hypothetical protein